MTDDDELALDRSFMAQLPAMRAMHHTERISAAWHGGNPGLDIPAALHAMHTEHMMTISLRVWALIVAEVAPPRLPGGALVEGEQRQGTPHLYGTHVEAPERTADLWYAEFVNAATAARDRDGGALWESIPRGVKANAMSYVSSFALSAVNAIESTAMRRPVVALLHLFGQAATSADVWSYAGQAFRLTHAFMAAGELGSLGTDAVIAEFEPYLKMPHDDMLIALALVSAVAAVVMGGDPAAPIHAADIEVVPAPGSVPRIDAGGLQVDSWRCALRLIEARRSHIADATGDMVGAMKPAERLWALWGCANLLAARVAILWGPE